LLDQNIEKSVGVKLTKPAETADMVTAGAAVIKSDRHFLRLAIAEA